MRTWKIVSGVICIILFVFIFFQSRMASLAINIRGLDDLGDAAGLFVAFLFLAGGIIHIVTNNIQTLGTRIALVAIFTIAAILCFTNHAVYKDLLVYGIWSVINAFLALIDYGGKDTENGGE